MRFLAEEFHRSPFFFFAFSLVSLRRGSPRYLYRATTCGDQTQTLHLAALFHFVLPAWCWKWKRHDDT